MYEGALSSIYKWEDLKLKQAQDSLQDPSSLCNIRREGGLSQVFHQASLLHQGWLAATWWKPSSDESEEKTSCCSFISWMLGVIVLWGGRKPFKISGVSLGAICLFAKPRPWARVARSSLLPVALSCCVWQHPRGLWVSLCALVSYWDDFQAASAPTSVGNNLGLKR